jgi:hypothetical protein
VVYPGVETMYSTTYVNLSVLARMKVFKSVYSTTGPQFSFPVRSKLGAGGSSVDINDNINWDWSLLVGIGQQFGRIGIEGRWDAGFKGIEEIPLGGNVKRNRAITIVGIVALK